MRLSRVLAVTRRDLAIELAGRRGAILPTIAGLILLPIALAPGQADVRELITWRVRGDVPAELAAHPEVEVVSDRTRDAMRIVAPTPDDPQWVVHAPQVPRPVREALDGLDPRIDVQTVQGPTFGMPQRSLFLALVAASMLTGALSQSLPGERSQRTLETLLTASITRGELIVGKWLAWGGFGSALALVSIAVAVGLGRQELGWWVLAAPWVSFGTVALGFWLVRRAHDVVGGATVAIRMLPAALTFLGLLAWYLGSSAPWVGASVPLGGALLAAGDAWPGAGPVLWACAVTGTTCALLLRSTARDLEPEASGQREAGLVGAVAQSTVAALAWWTPVAGPLIWAAGGSPERTAILTPRGGVWAGGLALAALVAVRLARSPRPLEELGLIRPPGPAGGPRAWVLAIAAGIGLGLAGSVSQLVMLPVNGIGADVVARLGAALHPAWAGPGALLLAVAAQELLFRGWVRRQAGEGAQVVLSTLVLAPLDPVGGVVTALVLGGVVRASGGSVLPAILVRLVAAALPTPLGPVAALVLAGVLVAGLFALRPDRHDPAAVDPPGTARAA